MSFMNDQTIICFTFFTLNYFKNLKGYYTHT